MSKDLNISFEFFPAKDDVRPMKIYGKVSKNLNNSHLKFFSVTFGAGGGERDKSDYSS